MANGGIIGTVNNPTSTTATGVWQQEEQYEAKVTDTWPQRALFTTKSARFNSGSSDSLTKSLGTPTSTKIGTFSCWVKLGNVTTEQTMLGAYADSSNRHHIEFQADHNIEIFGKASNSTNMELITNAFFRDVSAWYNIVVAYDTSQGTASNRVKLYVNGVQETSFATETYPAQDTVLQFNTSGSTIAVGRNQGGNYADGYMCEVVFIDGQQLAPTDFGEFDEDSGIWKPINVSGLTAGNNGFYLDFEASGNLGNDAFGGTDLTENNLTAIDQTTDTCTNNFATLNPLNNYWSAATFSEGNSVYTSNNTSEYYGVAQSTIGVSSGKWYFEAKVGTQSGQDILGITSRNQTGRGTWLGSTTQAYGYYQDNGEIRSGGSDTAYGQAYTVNDIIGIYMDLDNNKMYVSDNGVLMNSGTGHTITAASLTDSGFYHFAVGDNSDNTQVWQCNFGGTSGFTVSSGNTDVNGYGNFEYDPSAGTFDGVSKDFLALCTKNLAEYG